MTDNPIRDYWLSHQSEAVGLPRLQCADGFTMSVQASATHYCEPRAYLHSGDYSHWEVGFPNEADELLMPYVENEDKPTTTVYGYVPTEVINQVIAKHGGIIGAVKTTRRKRRA